MKNKFLSVFLVGLMVLPLAGLVSGANVAFADNDHGKKVSEAAKSFKGTKGEHGKFVSSVAREKDDDDDDDNNNNNNDDDNRGRGKNTGGISDARIQALERLIALIQEQIQILLARLNELRGDVNASLAISSVAATEIKTAEAKIVWLTNRIADSKVYFSTSSPVDLATARIKSKGALEFSHRVSLDELSPNTIYFFIVESRDNSNNIIRSAQFSFATLASSGAPVISSVSVSGISTSSANVLWTTDKPATSKVYFSTSSPVNLATASVVSDSALVSSHSLGLTGLASSTNYFFIVESTNASSIVGSSAQFSFLTTP